MTVKVRKAVQTAILAGVLSTTMLLGACSNGNTSSDSSSESSSSSSDVAQAVQTGSPEMDLEKIANASVGDTFDCKRYEVYTKSDGTSVYYARGKYVFVSYGVVVETREAVAVPDVNSSVLQVLKDDPTFDTEEEVIYYFYNNSDEMVTYDNTKHLTAEVPYCLAEYVKWDDETQKTGILHSFAFTYGDAPVSIITLYAVKDEDTTGDSSSSSSAEGSTSGTETDASGAESSTSGTEADTSGAGASTSEASEATSATE